MKSISIDAIKSISILIASFFILCGCSSQGESDDFSIESLPVLTAEETLRFSESEDMLLGSITQLHTDSEGNIILVDGRQRIIHAVDPQGNYIQQIGATGSGPGEYQFPGLVSIGPDDALHVMDWSSRRVISYRKNEGRWTFHSDFIADQDKIGFLSRLFPLNSDEFHIVTGSISANSNDMSVISKIDGTGNVLVDSILTVPSNQNFTIRNGDTAMMSLSQSDMHRQAQYAHDYNGAIYYGWSDSLTIMKMTPDNNSFELHADIKLPDTPFTQADADSILSGYESLLEGNASAREDLISSFPETKPAFSELQADETGRLWAQLQLPGANNGTWLILDPNGNPAYRAIFDSDQNLSAVRNGKAYVVSQSDLGVPEVTVFEFEY
ncbi:6-bladed beta-propeller [Rhodohalobacter mucosus]|uniref:6-bladed beta-propeller protein n=1 Tax=Rhodohalobacter mucosus TaxID=2079485 RepID=A0A316TU97_9BACT|nr:6-bladed beta-propeller [Rhodohalobacter mucosus]PWN05894.1 hypothetical protein DDZ15_11960 [Rhodohalobacter mucosus]